MEESEIVSRFSKFTETRSSWTPTAFCSCEGAGVQEMCVAVNPLLLCGPCLRPHPLESHSFLHRISSSAEPPIQSWQLTDSLPMSLLFCLRICISKLLCLASGPERPYFIHSVSHSSQVSWFHLFHFPSSKLVLCRKVNHSSANEGSCIL